MKNWSIQRRVLLIALLPAGLLAVVLSIYNAHHHIRSAEQRTLAHARAAAAQIEPIAARGLSNPDHTPLLRRIAARVVVNRGPITGLTVRGPDGEIVARAGEFHAPTDPTVAADRVRISRNVRPAAGYEIAAPANPGHRIGSIELMVDLAAVRREQVGGLLEGLGLTALALGVTALVAVRIGRSVTDPVHELLRGVERIRTGDYDYRPQIASGGELGELENGVRELAAGIEETQRSLHERIEEATRELQETLAELEARNEELEAARSEAEAASEFKSRFLANISHEIRTPMNSILGFTELLSQADLDPVHVDYLVTIRNSAQSLLSLLNGILDLSKIESGRMELEYADTDVNALLFETFNLLAPQAFAKGVEFVVVPARPRAAAVRVDAVRLQQVLINLASNAVKFTDRGYVRIGADAVPRADGGIGLTFSCADTGRGIPHDAQARLFQAFAQGENLRSDGRLRPAGTGLGLHIASEIVFLMDGLIEFRSEPGQGSEFWFRLELESASTPGEPAGVAGPRRRVLLVSDEADVTPAHVDILAGAGIDARPVSCEAAAMVASPELDAILVDIPASDVHEGRSPSMPETLSATGVPVLAYAYAQGPELRRRLIEAGYHHVVQKNPEPGALRAAFERALGDNGAAGGPAPAAGARAPRAAPRQVLIVDDQPLNLKLLETFLAGTRYETVTAGGSGEALYHARLACFDAILMDIHLPDRDGIQTCREMRQPGEPNAHTPIIAVTADAFADQAHEALSGGMNDVLVKPVSRSALLEKLDEWCHDGSEAGPHPEKSGGEPRATEGPGRYAPQRDSLPAYDEEDARRRAGGQASVASELFDMLRGHLPDSRAELRAARAQDDPRALLSAAHRLKGAAAYCGVPRLRADLEALETRIRQGEELDTALTAVYADIDALLDEHATGQRGAPG